MERFARIEEYGGYQFLFMISDEDIDGYDAAIIHQKTMVDGHTIDISMNFGHSDEAFTKRDAFWEELFVNGVSNERLDTLVNTVNKFKGELGD